MSKTYLGWHFLKDDLTASCGSEPAWRDGETRTLEGKPILCQHGYHASQTLLQVLNYINGDCICRVRLSGIVSQDTDKMVGQSRTLLWHLTPEQTKRVFVEWAMVCARRALENERKAGREPLRPRTPG